MEVQVHVAAVEQENIVPQEQALVQVVHQDIHVHQEQVYTLVT